MKNLAVQKVFSTSGSQVAFEVVAPSIPGYAFSSAPTKRGFNAKVDYDDVGTDK